VALSIFTDFVDGAFKPGPQHDKSMVTLFDQLVAWSRALSSLRG
jgi:hypothetical protein